MKYLNYISITSLLILSGQLMMAQGERKHIRDGNKAYQEGEYRNAEILYRKGLDKLPGYGPATYNLGNALYMQQAYNEAIQQYQISAETNENSSDQAMALHNLGNAHIRDGKIREAIEAYKQALRLNPSDEDTRYNLSWALQRMNQEEQDQQGQDEQNQDQQEQDQQEQQEQQGPQDQQGQQEQKEQPAKGEQISKEDAERMLQALKNDEQKTLDKVRQQIIPSERRRIEKDW